MTIDEAARILAQMYEKAPVGEKAMQFHLFGIQYANEIALIPAAEIAVRAGLGKSYGTEINKGRNLARYVQMKS